MSIDKAAKILASRASAAPMKQTPEPWTVVKKSDGHWWIITPLGNDLADCGIGEGNARAIAEAMTYKFAASQPQPSAGQHVYTIHVWDGEGREIRERDWGYFFKEADARQVIEENQTDISELGYYQYAVLCKKEQGPLAVNEYLQWYEFFWDKDTLVKVVKINCPKSYEQFYIPVEPSAASEGESNG